PAATRCASESAPSANRRRRSLPAPRRVTRPGAWGRCSRLRPRAMRQEPPAPDVCSDWPAVEPAPRRAASRLARAFAPQHDLHRLQQDHDVENEALILHVVEIELQLLERILLGRPIGIAKLRPPSESGLHAMPLVVIGNLLGELARELGTLGARSDETHVAFDDVEQLRELVEA